MAQLRHARLHLHHHFQVERDAIPEINVSGSEPFATEPEIATPVELVKRSTGTCSSSDNDCKNSSGGPSTTTIAITVSIIVPVVIALVVFVILHRRHQKKLRLEDANDPHKSFDFGIDPSVAKGNKQRKGNKKGGPEMTATNKEILAKSLHGRGGLSMDIGGSPYLLPPEMQNSRESLHSLSRSLGHGTHDPYRPATHLYETGSQPPSVRGDDSSIRTGSTGRTGRGPRQDGMNQNLLRNAQRMSTSGPPPPINEIPDTVSELQQPPAAVVSRKNVASPPQPLSTPAELDATKREASPVNDSTNDVRKSNNYLAGFIHSREASIAGSSRGQSPDPPHAMSPPPRGQSIKNPVPAISIEQEFPGANLTQYSEIVVPPSPDAASRARGGARSSPGLSSPTDVDVTTPFYTPTETAENPMSHGLGVSAIEYDSTKRLSILRPLPPDDPADTAEQRANRIRSFYKEYFSDGEAHAYQAGANYYEDYGSEFLGDATVFDPTSGQFVVANAQFTEPVTRRAMTPPPRGPPRRFIGPGHMSPGSSPMPPRGRAFSTASTSRLPAGGRPPPKRQPPPKALRTLPTPHLLKEDAFALPIDFAPPKGYKDRAAGRPDSPFMESRPYSPAVPIASPLASAFNDLPAMPSPHLLRKSGTFTALDFAPPPKFRNDGAGSDAGSIKSGRSGHSTRSAAQVQNIRAGAYRLSRIPVGLVGSRKEFEETLRPQWKLGN